MKHQVILLPYVLDQKRDGLRRFTDSNWIVLDPEMPQLQATGDMPGGSIQQRMCALFEPIAPIVRESVKAGIQPVVLNGDCCIAIPTLAGLQQAGINPTLIWLDAHADFNTWETTPSGFLGGMPLAMMLGLGEQIFVENSGMQLLVDEKIIATDLRNLDQGEVDALAGRRLHIFSDLADLIDFEWPEGPLYVHFDTDILDEKDVMASNYPEPNGPSLATIRTVFEQLRATGRVTAVSVSSWNPDLDRNDRDGKMIMGLLEHLVAK